MKKRLLATLLTLCLLFSLLPIGAMAANELPAASNGVVTLTSDTDITTLDSKTSQIIDLNGNTLTITDATTLGAAATTNPVAAAVAVNVTIKDSSEGKTGKLALTSSNTGITVTEGSSLTVDGVVVRAESGAAFAVKGKNSTLNIKNGANVRAKSYCISTDDSTIDNNGVVINVEDSTLTSLLSLSTVDTPSSNKTCAVLMKVPGTLNITGSTVRAGRQAVVVLAGTAAIQDSTLWLMGVSSYDSSTKSASLSAGNAFSGDGSGAFTWNTSSGAEGVPAGTLVVGNYAAEEISTNTGDAKVTVTSSIIEGTSAVPAILVDGNPGYTSSVTVTGGVSGMSYVTGAVQKGQSSSNKVSIVLESGTYDSDVSDFIPDTLVKGTDYLVAEDNSKTEIGAVAKIGDTLYFNLTEAVADVKKNETITLLDDYDLRMRDGEWLIVNNGVIFNLDLGKHTLTGTRAIKLNNGFLTIKNGTVYGTLMAVQINSGSTDVAYNTLNVDSSAKLEAPYSIYVFRALDSNDRGFGTEVNVEGTLNGCIFIDGNMGQSTDSYNAMVAAKNPITVNIKDGATITANQPICFNGYAVINIYDGATLTGAVDGIAMKSGYLNIEGGTIISTGEKHTPVVANGNGSEMLGGAISISSNYNGYSKMTVKISGGTFTSAHNAALVVEHSYTKNESSPYKAYVAGLVLSISDGTFNGAAGEGAVYIAPKITSTTNYVGTYGADAADPEAYPTTFITGGTFNSDVSDYVQTKGAYVAVANAAKTEWTVTKDIVATITSGTGSDAKTDEYDNLTEAMTDANAASTATTIEVLKDVEGAVNVEINKTVTINLNGNKLTAIKDTTNTDGIINNGTLTISGGQVTSGTGITTVIDNKGTLTLDNTTVTPGAAATLAVKNEKTLNLTGTTEVKNGAASGNDTAVAIEVAPLESATATLEVQSDTDNDAQEETTKVTVGNIKLTAGNDQTINLNINVGTFGSIDNTGVAGTASVPKLIKGGTFASDVSTYVPTAGAYVAKKNDTTPATWTVVNDVVAKIGSNEYDSLKEALDSAADNATIILQQDVEEYVSIPNNKNLTLNLNGNTLTVKQDATAKNTDGMVVTSGKTLTIKGGIIKSGEKIATVIKNNGTLTLDGVAIVPGDDTTKTIDNQGTLTLSGATDVPDAKKANDDLVTAYKLTAGTTVAITNSGSPATLTVVADKDGNVATTTGNILVDNATSKSSTIVIPGGTFGFIKTNDTKGSINSDTTKGITGGTFDNDVTDFVQVDGAYVAKKDGEKYVVQKDIVAVIGTKEFNSLTEALEAADTNSNTAVTIQLKQSTESTPVEVKTNTALITLDLNGKTLTLKKASGEGASTTGISVDTDKKLEIKNGIVTSGAGITTVIENKGALTLTGVTVTPGADTTVGINNSGTLTLKGATTVSNAQKANSTAGIPSGTKIAIKTNDGSEVKVDATESVTAGNILVDNSSTNAIKLNIASGTYGAIYPVGSGSAAVKGDNFGITGGTFAKDVSSFVQTEGCYASIANSDKTYTVKVDAAASITSGSTTTTYKTLAAAISGVDNTDGLTIKLLKDVTEGFAVPSTSSVSYVIDLNSHTLTISKTDTNNVTGMTVASYSGKSVTFKNGTITSDGVENMIVNNGTLILEDVTVTPADGTLVAIDNKSDLTLKGTTTVNNGGSEAISMAPTAKLTVASDVKNTVETTKVTVGDILLVAGGTDDKITLAIDIGTFGVVKTDGNAKVDTGDTTGIMGGNFANDVTKYCLTKYAAIKNAEGTFDVGEVAEVETEVKAETKTTENDVQYTTTKTDRAITVGENTKTEITSEITLNTEEKTAEEQASALETLAKAGELVIAEDGTMTDKNGNEANVTIIRQVTNVVSVKEASTTSVVVDITPKYTVYATLGEAPDSLTDDKGQLVEGVVQVGAQTVAEITEPVTVSIALVKEFAEQAVNGKAYITHTGHGNTNYYPGTISEVDGVYMLTFENPDGFSEFKVTLENPYTVQSVAAKASKVSVNAGATLDLSGEITTTPAKAVRDSVKWSSADETIATVDESTGVVTGVKVGTTTITVNIDGHETTITVNVTEPVTGVTLDDNQKELTLAPKDTVTLNETIAPADANNKAVTWKSSDETVATVDQTGKVTAVDDGKADITVTTVDGGFTATCKVTVKTAATGVSIVESDQSLKVGETVQLSALVTPEKAAQYAVWSSGDETVATIDQTGKVTAVGAGTATITVTVGDKSNSRVITVTAATTGDNTGDNTKPDDNQGDTTKPDDNKGDTTKPDDNKGDTTKPDDNKGDTTKPDDNKGDDDKNEGGNGGTTTTTPKFTDVVAGEYYEDAVNWAVAKEITTGKTSTTFDPNGNCTRAQVVTFLWRAAGSPEPKSTTTSFTDVNVNEYYAKAVAWAVENGITNGTGDKTFSPNATCTRAQVVTFLWRYENKPVVSSTSSFKDVAAGSYYVDAVNWAVANGITTGTSSTTFQPNTTCSRAMVVTFLYRDLAK